MTSYAFWRFAGVLVFELALKWYSFMFSMLFCLNSTQLLSLLLLLSSSSSINLHFSSSILVFKCEYASLKEVVSVRPSVHWSVRRFVDPSIPVLVHLSALASVFRYFQTTRKSFSVPMTNSYMEKESVCSSVGWSDLSLHLSV